MSKKLFLRLKSGGINSLGLDIVWSNPNFCFFGFESLGVFDRADCALQDSAQGRLVVSSMNDGQRNIIGEHEFLELDFEWAENAKHETVEFSAENLIARDSDGNPVAVVVIAADYNPDPNTITFVWRDNS